MANERKSPPVFYDLAQVQQMQRLELGEAMAIGDQDRINEIGAAKAARGEHDMAYEMSKSEAAFAQFMEKEAQREKELAPQQEQKPDQPAELTAEQTELFDQLEAVRNSHNRRHGIESSFDDLKEESQKYDPPEFYGDNHPEHDGPDHDL